MPLMQVGHSGPVDVGHNNSEPKLTPGASTLQLLGCGTVQRCGHRPALH
jgi:hypothetical protein